MSRRRERLSVVLTHPEVALLVSVFKCNSLNDLCVCVCLCELTYFPSFAVLPVCQ